MNRIPLGKFSVILLCALLTLALPFTCAWAENLTLHTISCFAGGNSAGDAYVSILRDFETATGCTVVDESSSSNEAWKSGVIKRFAAGDEPDVLFFFAAGADSKLLLNRLVPVSEINAAYPDLSLPQENVLKEADGQVYAVPVYSFWEGLYVNTGLFERFGLELPTDWEKLVRAIEVFRDNDIVPVSVSLSDIPHYLAEFAMLACVPPEELAVRPKTLSEVPSSWFDGMRLIRELYELGAFPENAAFTEESVTTGLFLSGQAAMQFDGSWQVADMTEKLQNNVSVLPMPLRSGGQAACYPGGVSMGFFVTRKAWNSNRRDAAVSLLTFLTSKDSLERLNNQHMTGNLRSSWEEMVEGRPMSQPLQDAMNQRARETWLLECVPAVAEGSMTAEECWRKVMELNPFGE